MRTQFVITLFFLLVLGAFGSFTHQVSAEMTKPASFDTFRSSGGDMSVFSEDERAELRAYLAESGLETSGPVDLELASIALDAETYQAGDTAILTVSWDASSIRSFIETDAASHGADPGELSVTASLPCTDEESVSVPTTDRLVVIPLSVTSDCESPSAFVTFIGDDERLFGEWTINEPEVAPPPSSKSLTDAQTAADGSRSGLDLNAVIILIILVIFLVGVILTMVKSRKRGMNMLAFFLLLSGLLPVVISAQPNSPSTPTGLRHACHADGTQVTLSWNSSSGATTYPYRLDKNPSSFNSNCSTPNAGDECSNLNTSTSRTFSIAPDTDYKFWVHARNDGGWSGNPQISFNCPSPPPPAVDGVCGFSDGSNRTSRPTSGLCSSGTASSVNDTGNNNNMWDWTCYGENGGLNASCSAHNENRPEDGRCGGATGKTVFAPTPDSFLCSRGNPSSISGSGPWSWTCYGENGGSDISCSASPYVCTGSLPQNAYPHDAEEEENLTEDLPWAYGLFDAPGGRKCEFTCGSGYYWGEISKSCRKEYSAPPELTFWTPAVISRGESAKLTWNSQNTNSCTASLDWSGEKGLSGYEYIGPQSDASYKLTCTGSGGIVSKIAGILVTDPAMEPATPAPTVILSAFPASIERGETSILTWYSENTISCTASGGWSGAQTLSGSLSVTPTETTAYELSCAGPNGNGTDVAVITVSEPNDTNSQGNDDSEAPLSYFSLSAGSISIPAGSTQGSTHVTLTPYHAYGESVSLSIQSIIPTLPSEISLSLDDTTLTPSEYAAGAPLRATVSGPIGTTDTYTIRIQGDDGALIRNVDVTLDVSGLIDDVPGSLDFSEF